MQLHKATLTIITTLFLISGCSMTNNEEQQKQLNDLQTSLQSSQQENQAITAELTQTKAALATSEESVQQLTAMTKDLKAKQKANTKVASTKKLGDKTILGQSEWIYVSKIKKSFKARIDTGAATSSINAVDIERFERDGKKWVRFNLAHSEDHKEKQIEARIVRIAKIVQSSKPGVETERLVVKLHIRIAGIAHSTEFTLTDRTHMEYPILIGRSFMQDLILVDVSRDYIQPKYTPNSK